MRLNKFLANAGVASRRKSDELILDGRVLVNGQKITELGISVNEKKDKVEVDGKRVELPSSFVYIKLNKPKGYICSAKDDRRRKTVFDIVKIPNVRLFNVGRLDYDTEGLLILTNDGDFAQSIIHPSFVIEKEYYCTIKGFIKESELAVLRAGVVINGKRLPKAKVEVKDIDKTQARTRLVIKITEGQNRQIRRMMEAIGKDIILLKRVAIGGIKLGGLARGEYKELNEKEIMLISLYKEKMTERPVKRQ